MKQLNAQSLQELLVNNNEKPLTINNTCITGSIKKTKLSDINFIGCHFFNADSTSSLFSQCTFIDCKFIHSTFYHTQLTGCSITDSSFFSTSFHSSLISTSKISNVISSKVLFEKSSLQYTKLVCNSLISTTFKASSLLDVFFEYVTLDASTIEKCRVYNCAFRSSSMRGIDITGSIFENTSMDFINFDDTLSLYPSEFFIPSRFLNIRNNTNAGLVITNSNLKKTFKNFGQSIKSKGKQSKKFNILKWQKNVSFAINLALKKNSFIKFIKRKQQSKNIDTKLEEKEQTRKYILPHNLDARNIGSITTFSLQTILTVITFVMFKNFYTSIDDIFYKTIPNIVDFPLAFIPSSIEMHKFAFYFSLLYFVFSAIMFCINVACVRGVRNLLLIWVYKIQSVVTLSLLFWIWKNNIAIQSVFIAIFNIIYLLYFFIMFVQSFNTTSNNNLQSK